jgi:PAS domain S-box-containing protein
MPDERPPAPADPATHDAVAYAPPAAGDAAALAAAALAQLTEGVILADARGRIIFVNEAAARLHGVARLDAAPDAYADTYQLLTEDGRPYPSLELPLARAVLRGETVTDARWRIRRPDGTEVLALGSARPVLGPDGAQVGAVLTVRDDTARAAAVAELQTAHGQLQEQQAELEVSSQQLHEQQAELEVQAEALQEVNANLEAALGDAVRARRSADAARARAQAAEARLHAAFAQAPAAVSLTEGPEHRFVLVNARAAAVVGRDDLVGQTYAGAFPELAAQGFAALLDRVYATGEPYAARETPIRLPQPDGEPLEVVYDFVYQPLRDAAGRVTGILQHAVDVTASVRAREALAASQERYALAARATSNAIWDWDLTTDALVWNDLVHTLFAHPAGTVPASVAWWYEAIHPDDRARVADGIRAVIDDAAGATAWQDEYRFRRGDGTYARVVDRGHVARAAGPDGAPGRAYRMIGAMEDVTAERAAAAERERLLAESEAARLEADLERRRLAALLEQVPVGVSLAEAPSGRLVHSNAAVQRIWGTRAATPRIADYSGDYVGYRLGPGPEAARRYASEDWPLARALTRGETVADEVVEVERPDGSRVIVSLSAAPVRDADGAIVGGVVTTLDVTERERLLAAERAARAAADLDRRRLDAALGALPVGVIIADAPSGRLAHINPAFTALWGGAGAASTSVEAYSPEWTGYHVAPGTPRDGRPYASHEWPLARAVRLGETVLAELVDVVRSDGTRARLSLAAAPVRDAGGAVVGGVVTAVDVTERERLTEAERAARRAAEEANQAKSQFLATMSHELRTPLNAIGGYVQLLDMGLHGPVSEDQRGALARVQGAQHRLLALINDVLNFAKLEGGRVEYDVRAVDARDAVADVVPLVEPQMAAKRLALVVHLPDAPCPAWADREKLGQVLVNLLSNAMKFTDPRHPATGGPGRVTVTLEPEPATGAGGGPGRVLLHVADTGVGIPADKLEAVFEPFVQVRSGYAQATEGTGLGLAISRDLARGMGGDLWARSAPGEGSVFTVALLRAPAADPGA